MSHLFHRVHEQSYVAHVMGYAACIGPYKNDCDRPLEIPQNVYRHVKNLARHTESKGGASLTNISCAALLCIAIVHVIRMIRC